MRIRVCDGCGRQYDVTGFPPGVVLRCACDATFPVGASAPLPVEALRCTGCGGAVGEDDERCPWCGAGISPEDRAATTLCPACFTRLPDGARHCSACGLAIRPQALTPLPDGAACPSCRGALSIRVLDDLDVVECGACRGAWLAAAAFRRVLRGAAEDPDALPPAFRARASARPGLDARLDSRGYLPCLACSELMLRRQVRHGTRRSGVVVDYCADHGVWLDEGELARVVEHVRRLAADGVPADELARPFAPLERPAHPGAPFSPLGAPPRPEPRRWSLVDLVEQLLWLWT